MMIHSCGDFTHQLGVLEKVHNLRGVNFGVTETPFEAVWERLGGKTAIIPHLGLNTDVHFDSTREYLEHVMKARTHNRGLCIVVQPGPREMQEEDGGSFTQFGERVLGTLAEFG